MEEIRELSQSHVHIRDKAYVGAVLQKMIAVGAEKLQVVADFDRTLSKYTHHGSVCATTHSDCHCMRIVQRDACSLSSPVIAKVLKKTNRIITYITAIENVIEEGGLPEGYKLEAVRIRNKYYPIEIDPDMTIEEKTPYMVEWWTKAHELLLKLPLSQEMVHDMVSKSTARLRDGCREFFDCLHESDIPLLIFSAGITNIIREVILQNTTTVYNNVHIVSNELEFDEDGKMKGFKGEMVHVFNKNENAVHDSEYFQKLSHCTNVLLMGDSLGDLQMANGAEHVEAKLTIGFLNQRVAESLEQYKSNFDIVICEDESLDIVNAIIHRILTTG